MKTNVEFGSALFTPYLPDDAQVNPGVFGAELAFWLSQQLARRGVMTSYPLAEDWGWFVEYDSADGHAYRLCCANRNGVADGWLCFLEPKAKRLFRRATAPAESARPLLLALHAILEEEPGIQNAVWY
jgi:hypothetical protein